jgi:membrane-bound ClpP family serine protease
MSVDVEAIFKVIAYGVPALMVLGGIVLLLLGLPLNNASMTTSGWALIILGAIIYVIEVVLYYTSS